jgi:hypothetical protein
VPTETSVSTDDELTELVDADIPRVDLVSQGANGIPRFLITKMGGPLMSADDVRDLLAKADYDTADRDRMANSGVAMDDGSYPIANRGDLTNAIHAVGRGGAAHDAIRRHIIRRAETLGASGEIPDSWAADGSLKTQVTKETNMPDDVTPDGEVAPDVTTALAPPDGPTMGAEYEPGSPAWESIDAATAAKWTDILARAKAAIGVMSDRELAEAAAGHTEDAIEADKLAVAIAAVDSAIGILAPHAVNEAVEAREGEAAMVGKTSDERGPLVAEIKETTVDEIAKTDADTEPTVEPVAKTEDATTGEQPAEAVAKAGSVTAVYDAAGRLVGVVDPSAITTVDQPAGKAATEAPVEPEVEPEAEKAAMLGDKTETGPVDMVPAPADEVGTPANAVPTEDDEETKLAKAAEAADLLKSIASTEAQKLVDAYSASRQDVVAKQAADIMAMAETIDVLKAQIKALEEQPAAPRVFTNGAVPPSSMLRGQDAGGSAVDPSRIAGLKKGLYASAGANAPTQDAIAGEMNAAAIKMLHQIHAGQSA